METWNGRRLGVERATTELNLDAAFSIEDLQQQLPLLLNGTQTLYYAQEVQAWGDEVVRQTLSLMRAKQRQGLRVPLTQICWRQF